MKGLIERQKRIRILEKILIANVVALLALQIILFLVI